MVRAENPASERATRPRPRGLTILASIVLGAALLLMLVVALAQTSWGVRLVARLALDAANPWPHTTLTLRDAKGGLFTGITLIDVDLRGPGDSPRAHLDTLRLEYRWNELVGNPHRGRGLELLGARIVTTRGSDGTFDLIAPFVGGEKKPNSGKSGFALAVDRIALRDVQIEARLPGRAPDSTVVFVLNSRLHAFRVNAPRTSMALDTLAVAAHLPAAPPLDLQFAARGDWAEDQIRIATLEARGPRSRIDVSGRLPVRGSEHPNYDGWTFNARLAPLDGSELQRLLGFEWKPGDVHADLDVQGHGPALAVRGQATVGTGRADLDVATIPSLAGPVQARARISAREFDLGSVLGQAPDQLVFNGTLDADLHGTDLQHLSGPLSLTADGSRVDSVTITRGRLSAPFDSGRAAIQLDGAAQGFELATRGTVAPFGSPPDYDLSAELHVPPLPAADAARREARPLVAGQVSAQLSGHGFALSQAGATLRATLAPDESARPLIGAGRLEAGLARRKARAAVDLAVSEGTLGLDAEADLGATIRYAITRGEAHGVNLAALLGDSASSRLDVRFRADGTGTDPSRARARAAIDSLNLTLGPTTIERGSLDAALDQGRVELRADAIADGAAVGFQGSMSPITPRVRDARLDWTVRELDVARVTGDSAFASALNLRGSIRASSASVFEALSALGGGRAAPAGSRVDATATFEPSRWRSERIERGGVEIHAADRQADISGEIETSAGRAHLAGEARPYDAPPSASLARLEFSDVAPARLLGNPALESRLQGWLTARASGRTTSDLNAEYQLSLDGSEYRGRRIDELHSAGSLVAGKLTGDLLARKGGDSLALAVQGTPLARPARLTAQGRLRGSALQELFDEKLPPLGARLDLHAAMVRSGAGLDSLFAEGRITGRARLGEARVDSLATVFHLDQGLVRVSQFHLDGNVATLEGSGQWAVPFAARTDSTRLSLRGTARDLTALAAAVGAEALSTGTARFEVTAEGPASATRFRGTVAATRPHYDQIWADSVSMSFNGVARDTVITALDARIGAHALVIWPLAPRDLTTQLNWDGQTLGCNAHGVASPERTQDIAFHLTPVASQSVLRLERQDLRYFDTRYSLAQPCEIVFGRELHVDRYSLLQNRHPCLQLNGGIDSTGSADLSVRLDSLALRPLLEPLGVTMLTGVVWGDGAMTGSRESPKLNASLRGSLATTAKRPASIEGRMHWVTDSLDASAAIRQTANQSVAFQGRIPATLRLNGGPPITTGEGPAKVQIDARQFDLSWFEPLFSKREVRGLRGTLDGHVELNGPLDFPALSGQLALLGGRVELPGLGVKFEKAGAKLALENRTARLEQASVQSGKGQFNASGRVELLGKGRRTIDLDADWRRFTMMNTLLAKLESTGKLKLTGRAAAPKVGGEIQLDNSTVYAEGSDLSRQGTPVELTEADRRDLQERFGVGVGAAQPKPGSLADSVDADVRVKVGKNVWVRRRSDPVVALEMEGDFRAIKRPAMAPQVIGKLGIRTGRSYLSFLGRQFEITRADVVMPGPVDSVEAELEARYDGQTSSSSSGSGATVTAGVSIDASGAKVDLQSEPYMDRASLMNYLATGQTQGEMASGSAYGLAVGSVLGAVGGAAGRSLGFQVVQVTQDAYGGQTLSAGNYVDPRVYLGFRQPVVEGQRSNQTAQGGSYSTEFEVEVELLKQLLFNVQGGGTQYRFLLRPRLGH